MCVAVTVGTCTGLGPSCVEISVIGQDRFKLVFFTDDVAIVRCNQAFSSVCYAYPYTKENSGVLASQRLLQHPETAHAPSFVGNT